MRLMINFTNPERELTACQVLVLGINDYYSQVKLLDRYHY